MPQHHNSTPEARQMAEFLHQLQIAQNKLINQQQQLAKTEARLEPLIQQDRSEIEAKNQKLVALQTQLEAKPTAMSQADKFAEQQRLKFAKANDDFAKLSKRIKQQRLLNKASKEQKKRLRRYLNYLQQTPDVLIPFDDEKFNLLKIANDLELSAEQLKAWQDYADQQAGVITKLVNYVTYYLGQNSALKKTELEQLLIAKITVLEEQTAPSQQIQLTSLLAEQETLSKQRLNLAQEYKEAQAEVSKLKLHYQRLKKKYQTLDAKELSSTKDLEACRRQVQVNKQKLDKTKQDLIARVETLTKYLSTVKVYARSKQLLSQLKLSLTRARPLSATELNGLRQLANLYPQLNTLSQNIEPLRNYLVDLTQQGELNNSSSPLASFDQINHVKLELVQLLELYKPFIAERLSKLHDSLHKLLGAQLNLKEDLTKLKPNYERASSKSTKQVQANLVELKQKLATLETKINKITTQYSHELNYTIEQLPHDWNSLSVLTISQQLEKVKQTQTELQTQWQHKQDKAQHIYNHESHDRLRLANKYRQLFRNYIYKRDKDYSLQDTLSSGIKTLAWCFSYKTEKELRHSYLDELMESLENYDLLANSENLIQQLETGIVKFKPRVNDVKHPAYKQSLAYLLKSLLFELQHPTKPFEPALISQEYSLAESDHLLPSSTA